jgi:hypothetical protein
LIEDVTLGKDSCKGDDGFHHIGAIEASSERQILDLAKLFSSADQINL